ncbi:MAG: two component regulator three y domain-containing protein [Reichenbachiella sp.]
MRKLICLLVFNILLSIQGFSQPITGLPYIKNFTTQDYNGGIINFALAQDKRGIIYAANNYGLLEYDGTTWRKYNVSNNTKLRSVAIDDSGKIFAGAQDQFGYYFPSKNGLLEYHSLSDSLYKDSRILDEVWKTYIIGDKVYFSTFNHIYKYDGTNIKSIDPNQSIEFTFSVKNQLYVQTPANGLSLLFNDSLVHITGSEILINKHISGILPYAKNELLIATENNGIFIKGNSNFEEWNAPVNQRLKDAFVKCLLQLSDGSIAIGTASDGLYIVDNSGAIIHHLTKGKGLINRTILCLLEDDYGNIWVGQNNGFAKIEYSSPFTFINENSGLQGTGYCSYFDGQKLYMGTNNGLFEYSNNDSGSDPIFTLVPNTKGQVYSIDKYGSELLLGRHEGASILKNNKVTKLTSNQGAWKFMIPRQNPNILIEGNYFGFQVYDRIKGQWKNPTVLDDFNESSRVFEEDTDGTIWMTHGYKGVFRLKLATDYKSIEEIQFYNDEDGFNSNQLINVFHINSELIFCSADGTFAYNKNKDGFELHDRFTSLFGPNVRIIEMEEDALGNVYFINSDSTGLLTKDRFGNYFSKSKIFKKIHSLLNDDLHDITSIDHNSTMFGAKEGFVLFNTQKQTKLLEPIQLFIRKIIISNKDSTIFDGHFIKNGLIVNDQPSDQKINLKYENNSILFNFSCTFSDELAKTEYSYKLEGFDNDWSAWNAKTDKEYTNLREKTYHFKVKSKNIYDVESKITSYTFTVLPPWYRTNTAYILFFILAISLISGIMFSQSFRHKKEKRSLTLKQERELIKKDNTLQEFSKKTEAEIVSLKNEKLALEINTKNKELATSTMNLLNKNKFLTELKDTMSQTVALGKSGENKKLKDMMKSIERNMAGDSEWEHFQHHFDQVHGDFSHRLLEEYPKLSPQEVKLSTYLRMNLSTKEIAQLLNITVRGVEIARYRLRKKLDLVREDNLTEFILSF